jgi:Tfp pilus assembly protein PilO
VITARRVLHEKRALIVPIAIALLVNVALYLMVVYPLSKKVDGGQRQSEAAVAALNAARRDFAAAQATVAGKGQADQELQKFYTDVLPPDISGARRITFLRIDQLAQESGLRVDRQTSDPKPQRDSGLVKFSYRASLSGDYRNIRRFVHELETAPEFLVLENLQLRQSDIEDRGLNVEVEIATYYRAGANGN